ncbi:MAG TPA: hypothetical protein GYA10_14030 [Alphaproteobacteria bacterium]|nr:hypothetical protein [Alphaproteobacteria bacterium]
MDSEWVTSAAARRILVHWADPRPAWLWSADGSRLIWRNAAARLFGAKLKKTGLKPAPEPVPIKGQVARLIRLGSPGRTSLSRIQFLAGGRPASTTASVTPLALADGRPGLLIVGVDPIDPEIMTAGQDLTGPDPALLPAGAHYVLLSPEGQVTEGTPAARALYETVAAAGDGPKVLKFKASPQGHQLVLMEAAAAEEGAAPDIETVRAEEGLGPFRPEAEEEPLLPMGLPPVEEKAEENQEHVWEAEAPPEPRPSLSTLFDRLAGSEQLYGEIPASDEPLPPVEKPAKSEVSLSTPEPDVIAAVIEFAADLDAEQQAPVSYRVIGRGFTASVEATQTAAEHAAEPGPESTESLPADHEDSPDVQFAPAAIDATDVVERTSRYNFDELSRILADRVRVEAPTGQGTPPIEIEPPIEAPPHAPAPERTASAAVSDGALINIAAETFILNRLPLGIMVFRDQQVLFANRALTDLVGFETIDGLRSAGLAAIFPPDEAQSAGPVTHLVRRDGTRLPVTARLQSITWQGRPALMLSASPALAHGEHEAAVRTFAQTLAETRGEGFFTADRQGVVTSLSIPARLALGRREEETAPTPLISLIHPDDAAALRSFLERPARFAETSRPGTRLRATAPGVDILLFAEGRAGIVTGYFGFVVTHPAGQPARGSDPDADADPSMLARVSRGVRRPLNTIIGFADLIRSAAFGTIENHRYLEYARDIKTAGQEIAVLVDELDDYARLRAGTYATRPAELDLVALLESCLVRVRGQASAARVLVRSSVSERLPRIRADRASLGQAVLNLLASAIDQTPPGGSVVLSAQQEEDGHVAIIVRDSGEQAADPGERFVVFRDGVGKDGEALAPVRSSVGLALTRALVAVNGCTLSVAPAGAVGTLFSLSIPADLVAGAAIA